MTREETIERLEWYQCHAETGDDAHAFDIAINALRHISWEQVEQELKSKWIPLNNTKEHFCESCGVVFDKNDYMFCPACGSPMTDEAMDMLMERLKEVISE